MRNKTETRAVSAQIQNILSYTRRDLEQAAIDMKRRVAAGQAIDDVVDGQGVVTKPGLRTLCVANADWMLSNLARITNVLSVAQDRAALVSFQASNGGASVTDWEDEITELRAIVTADKAKRRVTAQDITTAADETIAATPKFDVLRKLI